MGDNFLEAQAGNTRKRRAKAEAKRDSPKLIERPDVVVDEFTIECLEGVSLRTGDVVMCFPGRNGSPVDVVVENQFKGAVNRGGGQVLRQSIEATGIGKLHILSTCDLTETAKARLIQE